MVGLAAYDEMLAALYDSALGHQPLDHCMGALRRLFGAANAGVAVYDRSQRITHWLVERTGDAAPAGAARSRRIFDEIYQDRAATLLTRRWLDKSRRFSDLVPPCALQNAAWYRSQVDYANLGYGMLADLSLDVEAEGQGRIRPYVLRDFEAGDFTADDLYLFDRIADHMRRAFAGQMHRFAASLPKDSRLARIALLPPDRRRLTGPHAVEAVLRDAGLSKAEARVAALLGEGRTRDDTARALGVGLNTIKTHVRRIYAQLGVHRQSMLVQVVERLRAQAQT